MRPCPACGTSGARLIGSKGDYRVLTCKSCACIFVHPEPSPLELENFYHEYSYANHSESPRFIIDRIRTIISRFEPFRQSGNLLDVGCGAGDILSVATNQGWNAFGLESSGAAVTLARSKGLSVEEGDFLSLPLPSGFDVIVMSELIEHLTDPASFLRRAFEILRPGGLLYVTTPNGRSLSRWIMGLDWSVISPPEHIQLFNVSCLFKSLRRCGYRGIKVETSGLNVYALSDYLSPSHRNNMNTISRNDNALILNEQLTRSPIRRGFKWLLNVPLRVLHCGDSLRAWAIKPK
jgi:SAM-dependent methyltransferase